MSDIRAIRERIDSIQQTKKMLDAMYTLASNKFNSARARADRASEYLTALNREVTLAAACSKSGGTLWSTSKGGVPCCLVVSPDRGFSGSYAQTVLGFSEKRFAENPSTVFLVAGAHGRDLLSRHGLNIDDSFLYLSEMPTLHLARKIAEELIERVESGEFSSVSVIYGKRANGLEATAVEQLLIPFHAEQKAVGTVTDAVELHTSEAELADGLLFPYLVGSVYCALMLGCCCEQGSRMSAMDQARTNADDMIKELSLKYRKLRQSSVTNEIVELSSGMKSLGREGRI